MDTISRVIINKETGLNPIWLMRQAGRYLPEFRNIRAKNQNFIELCLNKKLVPEITLQPLKRYNFDAAIIFSDILMLPYGLGQDVKFQKNFGPKLGSLNIQNLKSVKEERFISRLKPVYDSMNILSNKLFNTNKSLIGFVGAPWTLLVYMLNKESPKKNLREEVLNSNLKHELIKIITNYLKIHIKQQVNSGATIIQIFDSWAGLIKDDDLRQLIYEPTAELVNFINSLNIPCICFPREIKSYKEFISEVKPNVISIDYNVNIKNILKNVNIPIQGGLDPKILLTNNDTIKKGVKKILDNFNDHPYIFNLGHGVLPETDPNMVDYLVKYVRDY